MSPKSMTRSLVADGEEEEPVFDTCNEIRDKITAHLALPGLTKEEFCQKLTAQLHSASLQAEMDYVGRCWDEIVPRTPTQRVPVS